MEERTHRGWYVVTTTFHLRGALKALSLALCTRRRPGAGGHPPGKACAGPSASAPLTAQEAGTWCAPARSESARSVSLRIRCLGRSVSHVAGQPRLTSELGSS